ncbi:MAG: endonuclease/exonuclease/phosphatase family protein [Planctomycetaceae bacterium]|nr:endonuclease/exonuclease/phosphatase family protein [Planctomycetaceae bacterium]
MQFITTHFGTSPAERAVQVEHLLGPSWLESPRCQGPLVLCGDFNAMPGSDPHRRLCERLRDTQLALKNHKPRRTWFGPLPLARIDHVFVDELVQVKWVDVPRSQLSKVASDHLPLVVDLEIVPSDCVVSKVPAINQTALEQIATV